MYKIHLATDKVSFDMPNERYESLFMAVRIANLYKKANATAHFTVINEDNGDIEHEI